MYSCIRCGFSSEKKFTVKQHLKRKRICESKLSDVSVEDCLSIIDSKEHSLFANIFKNELEKIKIKINPKSNVTIHGNNNSNNNINSPTTINITINAYDNTDYSVIKNDIHKCIQNGKLDEAKLIKLLHFNKRFPQNHNIKIDNLRNNKVMVYNGEDFEVKGRGQQGVEEIMKETIEKTEETLIKDNDIHDNHLIAFNNASIEYDNLKTAQQRQKINKISNVLYNGKRTVEKSHQG